MSCSRTQHGDPSGALYPDFEVLTTRPPRPLNFNLVYDAALNLFVENALACLGLK